MLLISQLNVNFYALINNLGGFRAFVLSESTSGYVLR